VINGYEIVVLLVIVAIVVGPTRLPAYAKELAALVRRGRELLRTTQDRVSAELGDAGEDVDWAVLDPRQYDPRRIVREALRDDPPPRRRATRHSPSRLTSVLSAKPVEKTTDNPSTDNPSTDEPSTDEPTTDTVSADTVASETSVPVFDDEAT